MGTRLDKYTYLIADEKGDCKATMQHALVSILRSRGRVAGDVAWYLGEKKGTSRVCVLTMGIITEESVSRFSSSGLHVCDLSSFTSCVISDGLLHFSEPQFPYL